MQFARDMDPALADRFVAMWVNDLTLDYTERGREAVQRLLTKGSNAELFPTVRPSNLQSEISESRVQLLQSDVTIRGLNGDSSRKTCWTSSWGARGGVIATPPRRSGSRRAHHRLQASDQAPPKA